MFHVYAGYLLVSLVPMFFLFVAIMALEGLLFHKNRRPDKPHMMILISLLSFASYIMVSILIFNEIACKH